MFDIRLLNLISFGLMFLAFVIAAGKLRFDSSVKDLQRIQAEEVRTLLERNHYGLRN